ncbi:phage tail family protein [Pseudobacillus sp. 179-B 2D1 NHS]|uniref:phage tail family protein n=1 Tax=Pseudobacillus sp. 179-B 2D1 NHS TaxID=3374292 RepID=UPI00387A23E0
MQKASYTNERGQSIHFDIAPPFILQSIEGTGNVSVNLNTYSTPNHDGKYIKDSKLDMRHIVLRTTIKARNNKQLFGYREFISSIFNPKLKGTLEYKTPNGTKKINAVIEETPLFSEYKGDTVVCLINLLCPDPYWYDLHEKHYTFYTPVTPAFSFPLNTKSNEYFSLGYESTTTKVVNNGHVQTPLFLKFEGGVKNIFLENLTTGEFIRINKKINSTDTLVINAADGQKEVSLIKEDGKKSNAIGMMSLDSSFLYLDIGENVLKYTAESDSGSATLHLQWNHKYLGI